MKYFRIEKRTYFGWKIELKVGFNSVHFILFTTITPCNKANVYIQMTVGKYVYGDVIFWKTVMLDSLIIVINS